MERYTPRNGIQRGKIKIVDAEQNPNQPLLPDVSGSAIIEGCVEMPFVSDEVDIQYGDEFEAIFDYTTTVTGDVAIRILDGSAVVQ